MGAAAKALKVAHGKMYVKRFFINIPIQFNAKKLMFQQ